MRHLISPLDFTVEELDQLLETASDIEKNPTKYTTARKKARKIWKIATLFYEPSTRTRLSFEAAMINLGGQVLGFSEASSSSASKGESVADTIRIISCYADICAMRHPKEGAALMASKAVKTMPIINAGDGGHFHPTQTLADLITIRHYKKSFDNLTVGLCGDLKFGRTIHSLVRALNRYKNVKFIFISPEELKMPDPFKNFIDEENYTETRDLVSVIDDLDVLYMSRVQKERFVSSDEYERLKDYYILTEEKLKNAKKDMIILHPLPRVNEIAPEVDKDPRAVYFEQTKFGMYGRMALIMKLLEATK